MKKIYILVFLIISVFTKSYSQKSLNDYSYVIVPEQFEFLDTKDKYQLNSIANFLFNKHGFHSFFSNDIPDAKRCDGLYADLENGKAFLKTKFTIVLKDCNGAEIYRSPEGVSKFKEFKKAYQDALRKAFKNIEALNVQQKEIDYFEAETNSINNGEPIESINEPSKVETVPNATVDAVVVKLNAPSSKYSSYNYDGKNYLLRKRTAGYTLYEESTTTENGLLLVGELEITNESKVFFVDVSENIFKASFDDSQNLIIKKQDGDQIFKLMH